MMIVEITERENGDGLDHFKCKDCGSILKFDNDAYITTFGLENILLFETTLISCNKCEQFFIEVMIPHYRLFKFIWDK